MTQIKDLRLLHRHTQLEIANMLGITRGAYANIENEKREPDLRTLFTLADYYDVTIDYLIGYKNKSAAKDSRFTQSEYALVSAYRAASPDDRAIIDNIVQRYTHENEASRLA